MLGMTTAIVIAVQVSPWPQTLLLRYAFEKGAADISRALEKHVPPGTGSILRQHYRLNDKDAYLDVFFPGRVQDTTDVLPTVVWVHGGGWISGSTHDVANYLKIVASYGYTVVGVDYSIAPGSRYPTPVLQINDALAYLQKNARRLHIDPNRIVLAGDSAGAQIAAQVTTITTNAAYAHAIGIRPALETNQLKATVLNCGAYDLALGETTDPGNFLKAIMWAYSGRRDFASDPNIKLASVANYVAADFPPTFITAGNADPLESQSREFAKRLSAAGVPLDALFYSHDHEPKLKHEYQFDLDGTDGQQALARMLGFLHNHVQ